MNAVRLSFAGAITELLDGAFESTTLAKDESAAARCQEGSGQEVSECLQFSPLQFLKVCVALRCVM